MHGLKQIATSQIYCCNSDTVDKVEKIESVTEREKKSAGACFNLKQQLIPHGVAYSYRHITFCRELPAEATIADASLSFNRQELWGEGEGGGMA